VSMEIAVLKQTKLQYFPVLCMILNLGLSYKERGQCEEI
jgi:hypothetical protein